MLIILRSISRRIKSSLMMMMISKWYLLSNNKIYKLRKRKREDKTSKLRQVIKETEETKNVEIYKTHSLQVRSRLD